MVLLVGFSFTKDLKILSQAKNSLLSFLNHSAEGGFSEIFDEFSQYRLVFQKTLGRYIWVLLFLSIIFYYLYQFGFKTLSKEAIAWSYAVYLLPISFIFTMLISFWWYEQVYTRTLDTISRKFPNEIESFHKSFNPKASSKKFIDTFLALFLSLTIIDALPLGFALLDLIKTFN